MDQFSKRFAALTPAQRELLARRLEAANAPAPRRAAMPGAAEGGPGRRGEEAPGAGAGGAAGVQFSLFFFSDDGSKGSADKYRLLFEAARYADENGYAAVWTPERHFQDFGGLYPNPSVLGAALAAVTRRIQVRAGSVALPLHNPIRVAEEWSVVDNISRGRVGVSFASGWHPEDFALAPSSYEGRREIMFSGIETVRRLWAGEAVTFPGVGGAETQVKILPRPVQERLPVWITSSGSRETWARAGAMGANILSGMKGEPEQDLAQKVALYRASLTEHGHDPRAGCVTVMLHTYVGEDDDEVRERVRAPLTAYLRTFIAQGERITAGGVGVDTKRVTESDKDTLATFAFENFFNSASLIGTPEKCARLVSRLRAVGVDEVACLIDFGLDVGTVMEGLGRLTELKARFGGRAAPLP
ncbi:MAG TPA: LLM class flavin-dependent oxidoreductase [Pyrinomonadaceae bacterium]|jgi:natural product biosynthesis luciferase-like monooxygenase protein